MTNVIILKAPDGTVAYTRPAGRLARIILPGDDRLGFQTQPVREYQDGQRDSEWLASVRDEVVTALAETLDPLPDHEHAPRFSPPDGKVSLEWLVAHRGQMRMGDILGLLAVHKLEAEPLDEWLERSWKQTVAGWQADPENCAHFLAMERVADIPASAIPTGQKYRDCWTWKTKKPEIDIDMDRARAKRAAELRKERNARLKQMDDVEKAARRRKQPLDDVWARMEKLCDAPEIFEPQLRKAKTLAELEAVTLPGM
jgi:hypothetical protein